MKVGIIGYKGFVGSALYAAFSVDKKYVVVGLGREEYAKHLGEHFDLLINANGNSSKVLAQKEPKKDFEMNASATLSSLLDFSHGAYIHISSIEVYGEGQSDPALCAEDASIAPEKLSNYGFSKYAGELLVKKYAKKWLILRLGGMVSPELKKGPVYDILNLKKLFVSSKSRFQFIHTREVARIAKTLAEKGRWGQVFNVAGEGNIELGEVAKLAKVKLAEEGASKIVLNVSCAKLKRETMVPATLETVKAFVAGD